MEIYYNKTGLRILFVFLFFTQFAVARELVLNGKPLAKTIMWVSGDAVNSQAKFRWLLSADREGSWKELPGITSREIVLLTEYAGQFVQCEVSYSLGQAGETKTVRAISASPVVADGNPNVAWFKKAGLGLMVHFLKDIYANKGGSDAWNAAVNRFDTERFASDCKRSGVSYVLWSLGQNDGYYCAPNAAYDSITGVKPGELCSLRDLPMDLHKSLSKRGIKLMLYLPGNPAHSNTYSVKGLRYTFGKDTPTSQYTQERLEMMIREWSIRYGKRVSGWWFDGMYRGGIIETRSDMRLPYNISTHTLAAKAGNYSSIVSYNYGVDKIQSDSPYDDYSAGEENNIGQTPADRWLKEGIQWFHFTFLGKSWGSKGVRYTVPELTAWAEKVFEKGGVMCFDVATDPVGNIDGSQLAQLSAIHATQQKIAQREKK